MTNIKETVALNSIYASGAMTVAKFTVGILTGSLGLLSEGLHSLLDLGATVMTYMAVRVSDKPADDKHHYGHGKIESVTALAETGLLFLTSIWVAYEAIHRLIAKDTSVEVTWWAIEVVSVVWTEKRLGQAIYSVKYGYAANLFGYASVTRTSLSR